MLDALARIRVGPSEIAAKNIGDISKVNVHVKVGDRLLKAESAMDLHWEGYKQSDGDELYHTVWDNVNGVFHFKLPFDCVVVKLNNEALENLESLSFDNDKNIDKGWLLEVDVNVADTLPVLMDEGDYSSRFKRDVESEIPGPTIRESKSERVSF